MVIPNGITVTFTALTQGRADELYGGASMALTSYGFIVTNLGDKQWSISIPIKDSHVSTDHAAMNAYVQQVRGVIKLALYNDAQNGQKTAHQALLETVPGTSTY